MPRLFLAADHRGFADKQRLLSLLGNSNVKEIYEITDLGPATLKPEDDFNDADVCPFGNICTEVSPCSQ